MGYKPIIFYDIPLLSGFYISDGSFGDPMKGFYVWENGCSIGGPFKSIPQARRYLIKSVMFLLKLKLDDLKKSTDIVEEMLSSVDKYEEWIENYRNIEKAKKEKIK